MIAFPLLTAGIEAWFGCRLIFGAHYRDAVDGESCRKAITFVSSATPRSVIVALPFFGTSSTPGVSPASRSSVYTTAGLRMPNDRVTVVARAHHMFGDRAVLFPFFSFMTYLDRGADREHFN